VILLKKKNIKDLRLVILVSLLILSLSATTHFLRTNNSLETNINLINGEKNNLQEKINNIKSELDKVKNEDQLKRNEKLQEEIKNINKTYTDSLAAYESIQDLSASKTKTDSLNEKFAQILKLLSEKNYASAQGQLTDLSKEIAVEKSKLSASLAAPASQTQNIPVDNTPPLSGYKRQTVKTDSGNFTVDIISADLNSTRVIVDTASDSNCSNDCPALPLASYISRNNAFAGINGSFFCPSTYPSCAGKTNSFDTLLMNKNKTYFNSDNNVYSTVPLVVFKDNWARFMGRSLEWGRDTSIDAAIANHPLLVSNGNSNFSGNGDPKLDSKGPRSFIGATENMVYIGFVHNATSAQAAKTLVALGIKDALGLDQGGSSALWYSGYKLGPGRNIPNAILFVKK